MSPAQTRALALIAIHLIRRPGPLVWESHGPLYAMGESIGTRTIRSLIRSGAVAVVGRATLTTIPGRATGRGWVKGVSFYSYRLTLPTTPVCD